MPANPPPPPRTFPRTFQELSSTKFMFFHWQYVGINFNTLHNLEMMLEVFNSMLSVICHKMTIIIQEFQ